MHLICPPPPPQKNILHNLCFSFLLGITALPRETELKTMLTQNFGGQIRCIMGNVEVAYAILLPRQSEGRRNYFLSSQPSRRPRTETLAKQAR